MESNSSFHPFNSDNYLRDLSSFGYKVMKNVIESSRGPENNSDSHIIVKHLQKTNNMEEFQHSRQFNTQCISTNMNSDSLDVFNNVPLHQENPRHRSNDVQETHSQHSETVYEYSQDLFKTLMTSQISLVPEKNIDFKTQDHCQYNKLFQSISLFTQETFDPIEKTDILEDILSSTCDRIDMKVPQVHTQSHAKQLCVDKTSNNMNNFAQFGAPPKKPKHCIKTVDEQVSSFTRKDSTDSISPGDHKDNSNTIKDNLNITHSNMGLLKTFNIKNNIDCKESTFININKNTKLQPDTKSLYTLEKGSPIKQSHKRLKQKKIPDMLLSKKYKKDPIKNVLSWLGNNATEFVNSIENVNTESNIGKSDKLYYTTDLEKNTKEFQPNSSTIIGNIPVAVQSILTSDTNGKMSFSITKLPRSSQNLIVNGSKKKSKFITPTKSDIPKKSVNFKIENLDECSIKALLDKFANDVPLEINFTIIYKEGFCQLDKVVTTIEYSTSPKGLLFYIKWNDTDKYAYLNFNGIALLEIQKLFISNLMKLSTRKICFEAQDIMMLLIDIYKFHRQETCLKWEILDLKVGCFLLDPDNPPPSFTDVLLKLSINVEYEITSSCPKQRAAHCLSLLSHSCQVMYSMLKECNIWHVFVNLETKLISILAAMELRGICIDTKILNEMASLLNRQINQTERDAFIAAGKPFQLNSPLQLRNILFNELKLDVKHNIKIKETSVLGAKSTSEPVLRQLVSLHPLPRLVLNYRHLYKAKATYVDSILHHSKSGIIRTTWEQTSAATGRLSSCNPNLQAMPKQSFILCAYPDAHSINPESILLRNAFIARPSYTFVAADFQHIEFRVFAHMTGDKALIDSFHQDTDIFQILTRKWINKNTCEEILAEDREKTKHIVYALMYGAGQQKLMETLNMNNTQVAEIMSKFLSLFPELRLFSDKIVKKCRAQNGILHSISGRMRKFPGIMSSNMAVRAHSERQAVNFVIQGSAADLCKTAMVATEHRFSHLEKPIDHHLILQIHDELVWEVPDDNLHQFKMLVREVMQHSGEFCGGILVPLPVVISQGKSWGHMV